MRYRSITISGWLRGRLQYRHSVLPARIGGCCTCSIGKTNAIPSRMPNAGRRGICRRRAQARRSRGLGGSCPAYMAGRRVGRSACGRNPCRSGAAQPMRIRRGPQAQRVGGGRESDVENSGRGRGHPNTNPICSPQGSFANSTISLIEIAGGRRFTTSASSTSGAR